MGNNNIQQGGQIGNLLWQLLNNAGGNVANTTQQMLQSNGGQAQNAYNTQVAVGNQALSDGQNVVNQAMGGKVNGYYVDPGPLAAQQNQNVITDASMPLNLLLGLYKNAAQVYGDQVNAGATINGQQLQNQVQNRQLSGSESLNGQQYNPNTNSVSFGTQAGASSNGYSPQAVQNLIDHGAKDLFADAKTPAAQEQLYNDIRAAGGIAQYRAQNKQAQPPGLADTVTETNETLKKIDYIQNQIQKSPSLKKVLDNPLSNLLLNSNNQFIDNDILHLSPADKQALAYMTTLNATNDRAQVGGRLDNYLLQQIGPSSVGKNQTSATNLNMLSNLKGIILNNLKTAYVTPYGYNSIYDLPGLEAGTIQMIGPDGKIHQFDSQYAQKALQNGYKEVK